MNKCFHWAMTALMVSMLALTACGQSQEKPATTQETPPKEATTASQTSEQSFTVGIDASYPPYDFRDEQGGAVGFDVDIIKAIATKQGFEVKVVAEDWKGLVADFDKGVYDISISGYANTDERQQKYLVSRPYSQGQDVVVTKKGAKAITSIEQLKSLKISVQGSSPYEEQLKGYGVTQIVAKSTSFSAFSAVARGEAEAMVVDKGVAQYYIQQLSGTANANVEFEFHEPSGGDFDGYDLVILTPKGKEELMDKINQGIVEIVKDGTYATIYKKWFGVEPDANFIPKV